ncbi:hypothetical protein C8Q75DRAFT_783252 [Abortiporus biennis]|nr:hypothetical protein C8Q75DRAFT_783252 [Abortiporus biennis]
MKMVKLLTGELSLLPMYALCKEHRRKHGTLTSLYSVCFHRVFALSIFTTCLLDKNPLLRRLQDLIIFTSVLCGGCVGHPCWHF